MYGTAAAPDREVDVLRRGVAMLIDRLPPGWQAHVAEQVAGGSGGGRADAIMDLIASDGSRAVLVLEPKRSVVVRDLPAVLRRLETSTARLAGSAPEVVPVLVARYLAHSARAWLRDHGVSYVDVTGNMRVIVDRPAMYLRDRGADRDPWRGPEQPRRGRTGPEA